MSTYREIVKNCLFNFPSLYKDKFDVNVYLFASHSYDWDEHGNLEYTFPNDRCKEEMQYDDLDERVQYSKRDIDPEGSKIYLLQIEIERACRELIAKNIDIVLNESCRYSFGPYSQFGKKLAAYMQPRDILPYATVFTYPTNIQKDWALAMVDFITVWLDALHVESQKIRLRDQPSGVNIQFENLSIRLTDIKEDLLTKATGIDRETRLARQNALVDIIIKELKGEG